ncbi:hypothetical protein AHAS_Ahas12G0208200 [Arachis hypogaea]
MAHVSPSTSSSSFFYSYTYDVFLSFRGKDTRKGFTGSLYNALRQRGIHTFIDDEGLRVGEEITPSLLNVIDDSRIAIVVFSKDYASSSFCLKELVKILDCADSKGRLVLPVFYDVDPSDVRHQNGSYGVALAKHEKRHNVEEWRKALSKAANLSGWHFKQGLLKKSPIISNEFLYTLQITLLGCNLGFKEVTKLLRIGVDDDKVKMVGIHGIGGIGKTTIACALYNSIADRFEASCFLSNVREKASKNGLVSLQESLLLELVGEDVKLGGVNHGIPIIKRRLNQKKVLLVLDDVDNLQQLRAIAGGTDWFGSGSRVIITTRDKHLLRSHIDVKVKSYGVKELNKVEALELLSWNAFKGNKVDPSYAALLNRAIRYANGLPLALTIIGSNLLGKSLDEWESALENYEQRPNRSIQEMLTVSYEGLEDIQKEIFLDIACFFVGEKLEYVNNMLMHGRGFNPEYGIGVLIQKSLLMDKHGHAAMHDLVTEMGREIVRKESEVEPGNRSRLWFYDDIIHVLEEDMGSEKTEIMIIDLPEDEEVYWTGEEFKKMKNLKILKVTNAKFSTGPKHLPNTLRVLDWEGYPSPCLPPDFRPRKLSMMNLPNSSLKLDNPLKNFRSLSHMNFEGCETLVQLPDISGVPNLTELCLDDCTSLVEVHDSIGFLHKLRKLSVKGCTSLSTFPHSINLTSLETLSLWGCSSLRNFPEILGKMEFLEDVDLGSSAIEALPHSIQNLVGLRRLDLISCNWLSQLPSSIFLLPKLESLEAEYCKGCQILINYEGQENMGSIVSSKVKDLHFRSCNVSDEFLPIYFTCFPNIEMLHLGANNFTTLPSCIKDCCFLTSVYLDDCKQLQHITALPPNIKTLSARNCISLTSHSTSMLLSQEIHEVGGTHFMFPGTNIPGWFDQHKEGASLSFWFRKKFPEIALCFVFGGLDKEPRKFEVKFHVFINGKPSFQGNSFKMLTDHVFLFDLQKEVELPSYQLDQVVLENEWNHVEIHCLPSPTVLESSLDMAIVKWSGVHVYKQGNNMDDVSFCNPQHRTYDLVARYPWIKNQFVLTNETSDSNAMVMRTIGMTSENGKSLEGEDGNGS